MFNTNIVDRRTTKTEVNNTTEIINEASGSLEASDNNTIFINIDKSFGSFQSLFSSTPYFLEKTQVEDGKREEEINGRKLGYDVTTYKYIVNKVFVSIKQVMVVGSNYTLEVIILKNELHKSMYVNNYDEKFFNKKIVV